MKASAALGRLCKHNVRGSKSGLVFLAGIASLILAALVASGETVHAWEDWAPVGTAGSSVTPVAHALAQGQGEAAAPNPLLYLDIWLFGGLILLVVIVVVLKYLWKFFQPDRRDPEEGLQPWEDPDYVYEEPEEC